MKKYYHKGRRVPAREMNANCRADSAIWQNRNNRCMPHGRRLRARRWRYFNQWPGASVDALHCEWMYDFCCLGAPSARSFPVSWGAKFSLHKVYAKRGMMPVGVAAFRAWRSVDREARAQVGKYGWSWSFRVRNGLPLRPLDL